MARLGIDVGSSGCKVVVFDDSGAELASARRSYPLLTPRPGWRELDAEHVWNCVRACLAEVCADGLGRRVTALAVSAQGEAIIPVDAQGVALVPAQVSFDTRSVDECTAVYAGLDPATLQAITGTPKHSMFSLYKLLWLQHNRPDVMERAWKIGTFADWIAFRLCGELVMDHSLASRTAMFDVAAGTWSNWVVNGAGVDPELLPGLAPCGTGIGRVRTALADELGVAHGVVVATGGHDQICCALGAGVVRPGEAMNSMGTTDSVVCLTPSFDRAGELARMGLACGSSAATDAYAMHAFVLSTGSIAAWFTRTWQTGGATLDDLAQQAYVLDGPSGLLVLPHMSGSGTPKLDERSTGVIAGLTLETTPVQVYRGVLEGICFELAENIEYMKRAGARIDVVKAIGGAAASDSYLQIKADIYGLPVARPRVTEAGCLGAALLAGHATGEFSSLPEAADSVAVVERWFEPDVADHAAYAESARRHAQLYSLAMALRGVREE